MRRPRARAWDYLQWGVVFQSAVGRKTGAAPLLLGQSWHVVAPPCYDGEPSHALLFTCRQQARAWCQQKHASYAGYHEGHVCRGWRFRVVRVRERVEIRGGR